MARFKVERVTPDEVDILVEGRVTLNFRNLEGVVRKIAASSYDRKPAIVPREDFIGARNLAIKEMAKFTKEQLSTEEASKMSDEDIARKVLDDAQKNKVSVDTALNTFTSTAKWCNIDRYSSIMSEIGKIGGKASSKKAAQRRIQKQKEIEASRQGKLQF